MGKMKRIIAASIVYIMAMMLIPVNTIIAKASEGEIPQFFDVSDLYITSISQYEDKSLITYTKDVIENDNVTGHKAVLSAITNGTEKVIQEVEIGTNNEYIYAYYNIYNNYIKLTKINQIGEPKYSFYEYDFDSESISEITEDYHYECVGMIDPRLLRDWQIEEVIIDKINAEFNLDINYGKDSLYINANYLDDKTENGVISYSVYVYGEDGTTIYSGAYGENFEIFSDKTIYQNFNSADKTIIFTKIEEEYNPIDNVGKYTAYLVKEGNIILNGEVELNGYLGYNAITFNKGLGIVRNYNSEAIDIYDIVDEKFVFKTSIPMIGYLTNIAKDKNSDIWTIFDEDDKRYIAKVEDNVAIKKYEISKPSGKEHQIQLYVYDENNIVVSSPNGTIFINNSNNESGENLLPEIFKGVVNTELFTDLYADETVLSLTVKEDVDTAKFQEQLDVFQNLNPESINMKGGAGTVVFRFTINIEGQVINVSLTNSNENVDSMLVDFFNKNKEEQPPVELPEESPEEPPVVIPPVIEDFIGSVVEVTEGNGTEEAPLVMDIKSVETEELTEFLDTLEELEPVVSKVEVEGDYTIFYIKVLRNTAARSVEEIYIKLVVKNDDTELLETLQKFEEEHKEVIEPEVPEEEDKEEDKEEVNPEVPEEEDKEEDKEEVNPEVPEEEDKEEDKEEVKPETPEEDEKEESVVVTPDKNDGKDETEDSKTEVKPETDKDNAEELPETGAVVSTSFIIAMAIVIVAAGLVMSRKGIKKLS